MNDHKDQRDRVTDILRKTMNTMLLNQEARIANAANEIVVYFAQEAHASDLALAKARAFDAHLELENAREKERTAREAFAEVEKLKFEALSEFCRRKDAVKAMQNGE